MSTCILIFRIFFLRLCRVRLFISLLESQSMSDRHVQFNPARFVEQVKFWCNSTSYHLETKYHDQVGSIQHAVPHICSPYFSIFLLAFLFLLAPEVEWQIIRRWRCTESAGISRPVGHLAQNMFLFMWLRASVKC